MQAPGSGGKRAQKGVFADAARRGKGYCFWLFLESTQEFFAGGSAKVRQPSVAQQGVLRERFGVSPEVAGWMDGISAENPLMFL